ncbi:hypothetical protein B5F09_08385 [Erysipelatoclostridium sp. An173]|uniref:hypothetical protein n=1 Tax=Erysipelatoclostridium sp. An173 TaxID=1965571 RepID=UPI000B3A7676|nr:hypothetical protein [Erysipelatoclostridium sp. An173]OUP76696.1 hypothetical protein B5F09_08385 [Erysipelatoclostridium sp. An173]
MKKRKKIQALLVSMVMSVTLLPSVVLAAQEGIPSVACEVTEDCILESGHNGECVLNVEDNTVLQTQTATNQIVSKAGNGSWDSIINQIRTIPRSDTWDGNGDIVVDIECPDYVIVDSAMLAWGYDPVIVNGIMISNTNKTVTLTESGLREFFIRHLEGGMAQIQFSLKNLNDASVSNLLVYCEVKISPLTIDESWPYDIGYFNGMQVAEDDILQAITTNQANTIKVHMTNGILAENILSRTVLNKLKENQKTLVVSYSSMYDAQWSFNGSAITDVDANVNLGVTISETVEGISNLIPENTATQIFEFSHSGTLPSGTSFMTELPKGKFGEISYLYHHNESENKLEYVGELSTAYNQVTMNLTHCSAYVLTDVKLPASDHVTYPAEHQHEYKVIVEKPATCIEAGYEESVCELCGDKQVKEIAALGHKFTWVTDKEATATEAGSKHEKCTVCGYEKAAVAIPALGTIKETSESSQPGNATSVPTGDDNNIELWVAIILAMGTTITSIGFYKYNRKHCR